MSDKTHSTTEEKDLDIGQMYTRTELFFDRNKKAVSMGIAAVVLVVLGVIGYKRFVAEPRAKEARDMMWKAEYYFEVDSLDKAIDGDGNYYGFAHIADKYGSTPAGSLAKFYLGVCYQQKGEYETALSYYQDASPDDDIFSVMTVGNQGDVLVELGRKDEAVQRFMKAADMRKSDYTTPMFLMKAGVLYRQAGDWKNAAKVYGRVVKEFPTSPDNMQAKKYAAESEAMAARG